MASRTFDLYTRKVFRVVSVKLMVINMCNKKLDIDYSERVLSVGTVL